MRRKQSYLFPVLCVFILTGCMVGGKYSRPPEPTAISYPDATKMDTSALAKWFDIYHDRALQSLIKAAIDSNRDFLAAAANMEVARALSGAVKQIYIHISVIRPRLVADLQGRTQLKLPEVFREDCLMFLEC